MTYPAEPAGRLAATPRSEPGSPKALGWRSAANRLHSVAVVATLCGSVLLYLASPHVGEAFGASGGALLLLGGAIIGVPHGSSDFLVAQRLMVPALGWRWLPWFLAAYLALVAATMAAWFVVPLIMLVGFLVISGLHFGSADPQVAAPRVRPGLAFAVRAATPVLPIFLVHPTGVAGFLAALGGVSEPTMLHLIEAVRWPLLPLWGAALAAVALPPLLAGGRRTLDAAELLATALAAIVLPPLAAFGLYFCCIHAVRHMLEIVGDRHPYRPRAAAALAAGIVAPFALACLIALHFAWVGLAGVLDTNTVVTWSLRIIAALTVPHMALEWITAHQPPTAEEV